MQHSERRASPRVKIFQPAELRRGEARFRGHLLNLSTSGCLIYSRLNLDPGARVHVHCGFSMGHGRIAWRAGPRFGLRFEVPLLTTQVASLVESQRAMFEAFTRRLGPVPA